MDVSNLATVLGPNMLWKDGTQLDPSTALVHSQQLNEVMGVMIENYATLFSRVVNIGDKSVEVSKKNIFFIFLKRGTFFNLF